MVNPTTPFEDTAGSTLTALTDEATYITALVAANASKITKVALPNSYDGRAMYYLKFGTPSASKRPLLLIASVHGDEVIAREAALSFCKWLVETSDTTTLALLAERELYVVPTGNPDGKNANLRPNGAGQDINRHYVDLLSTSPETRAFVNLIHTYRPVAVMDAHEWSAAPGSYTYAGMLGFASVDPELRQAQVNSGDYIKGALKADTDTPTSFWYPRESPANSVQHLCGLVGSVYSLIETSSPGLTTRLQRHTWQQTAFRSWLTYVATNVTALQILGDRVANRTASRVAKGQTKWFLTNLLETPVTAVGYTLTAPDWTTAQPILALHGVTYDAPTRTVYLNQSKAQIVTALLDPSSETKIVSGATRLTTMPPGLTPPGDTI